MANEVAKRGQQSDDPVNTLVKGWLLPQRGSMERLLPPDVDTDTFLGCAAAAMHKNRDLAQAAMRDPASLLIALRESARLGHMPGTDRYALTVRGGAILGIEQYQGVIARMFNAGAVQAVHAEVVTKDDTFQRRDPLPPLHEASWFDRDTTVPNLVGAYAYAVLDTGAVSRVVVMGRSEIMRHRAAAATTKIWDGPFGVSMWLKTVCHELEKWVPVSAEYRRAQAVRDALAARMPAPQPERPAAGAAADPGGEGLPGGEPGADDAVEGVLVDE